MPSSAAALMSVAWEDRRRNKMTKHRRRLQDEQDRKIAQKVMDIWRERVWRSKLRNLSGRVIKSKSDMFNMSEFDIKKRELKKEDIKKSKANLEQGRSVLEPKLDVGHDRRKTRLPGKEEYCVLARPRKAKGKADAIFLAEDSGFESGKGDRCCGRGRPKGRRKAKALTAEQLPAFETVPKVTLMAEAQKAKPILNLPKVTFKTKALPMEQRLGLNKALKVTFKTKANTCTQAPVLVNLVNNLKAIQTKVTLKTKVAVDTECPKMKCMMRLEKAMVDIDPISEDSKWKSVRFRNFTNINGKRKKKVKPQEVVTIQSMKAIKIK